MIGKKRHWFTALKFLLGLPFPVALSDQPASGLPVPTNGSFPSTNSTFANKGQPTPLRNREWNPSYTELLTTVFYLPSSHLFQQLPGLAPACDKLLRFAQVRLIVFSLFHQDIPNLPRLRHARVQLPTATSPQVLLDLAHWHRPSTLDEVEISTRLVSQHLTSWT